MFCSKCGNQVPDDSGFCPFCGFKLIAPAANNQGQMQGQNQMQNQNQMQGQNQMPSQNQMQSQMQYQNVQGAGMQQSFQQNTYSAKTPAKKSSKGPLIAVLSVCGVVIFLSVALLLYFKLRPVKRVDVEFSDYVKIEYSGYDGLGEATVHFDQDSFYDDYADDIKFTEEPKDADDYYDAAEYLLYVYVSGALDKSTGLSNGDKVKYIWDVDESGIEDHLNVDLDYDDIEFTVKDLVSVGQTDVFQYVDVTFSGRDGKGKATITTKNGSPIADWSFSADKMDNLSNGDTILVSLNDDGTKVDAYVADTGTSPVSITREYTVSGLSEDVAITNSGESAIDIIDFDTEESTSSTTSNSTTTTTTTTTTTIPSASSDDFFIPDSSTRTLTDAEVGRMSQEQIQLAINEIYAKHGYKFKDQNIYNYFCQFSWYKPITTDQADAKREFNSTENYNVELLQKYRY